MQVSEVVKKMNRIECVINLKSFSETQHEAEVKGSGNKVYRCYIDMEHPRKSKCNCPHADGRRVICKHMICLLYSSPLPLSFSFPLLFLLLF